MRHLAFFAVMIGLAATAGCADDPRPPCFLELPVYDPTGNQLDFRVTGVVKEGDKTADFLRTQGEFRMTVSGDRVYFPKRLANGLRVEVTLENKKGRKIIQRVPLLSCEQRTTVRYGQSDSGADVFVSTAEGRLSGCRLDGDWWVRSMPMFGTPDDSAAMQGYVRRSDGFFRVFAPSGERLIVVVGKGKEPIKMLAVNVTAGAKNAIGVVDLSGSCPK